jgi:hypothetical protein
MPGSAVLGTMSLGDALAAGGVQAYAETGHAQDTVIGALAGMLSQMLSEAAHGGDALTAILGYPGALSLAESARAGEALQANPPLGPPFQAVDSTMRGYLQALDPDPMLDPMDHMVPPPYQTSAVLGERARAADSGMGQMP